MFSKIELKFICCRISRLITFPIFKFVEVLKTPSAILHTLITSDEGFFKPPLFFRISKADNEFRLVKDAQQMWQLNDFNNFLHTKSAMYSITSLVNLSKL